MCVGKVGIQLECLPEVIVGFGDAAELGQGDAEEIVNLRLRARRALCSFEGSQTFRVPFLT